MFQTLVDSPGTISRRLQSVGRVKNLVNKFLMSSMSIINLWDLKSAQCFVCITPTIIFLTELSLVTKSKSFIIVVNDLVNGLIVISPQRLSQLCGNKSEQYCRYFLQSTCRYACFLAKKRLSWWIDLLQLCFTITRGNMQQD